METKSESVSRLSSLKTLKNITIEPVLILYLFATFMCASLNVALLMERVCTIQDGHSTQVCKEMFHNEAYKDIKIHSQKKANNILLVNNFVLTTPGIILAVFAGPWSDKYGRKPPIIIPLIGGLINYVMLTLMAHFKEWSPYFLIYATIPNALSGGFIHMMTLMSYVADVTSPEDRTLKYVFIEGVCYLANPLGQIIGGYIYKVAGFLTAYTVATGAIFCATLYACLFVKETTGAEHNLTVREYIREFFRFQSVKDCFGVFSQKRESHGRRKLLLLLLSFSAFTFYNAGLQAGPLFMYTQVMFNWGEYSYSVFNSIVNFASLTNNALMGSLLSAVLGVSDYVLGVTSAISAITSAIIMSLSTTEWVFYIGGLSSLFAAMSAPICRSMMTKIVQPGEIGEMFAFVSSVESFTPVLANVMDTQIYNVTVNFFPMGKTNLFDMETSKKAVKWSITSLKVLMSITIEPVMALYLFSSYLSGTLNVTILMERICTWQKGQPEEVCKSIFDNDAYAQLRIESQKVANTILLANNFVLTTPGIFLAVLTGPWSEKYGRKAPIIIPLIGGLINFIMLAFMAHFKELPPYFFICATIPNGVMGGFIHMMTLLSYVADVTSKKDRTVKYVFIEGVCFLANPLGQLTGGFIYKKFGLVTVYIIASTSMLCALLYAIFFLKETRGLECNLTVREYIREFFRVRSVKDCFYVMTKKRESNGRRKLLLLLLTFSVFTFYIVETLFMYTQVLFNWSNYTYSIFQSSVNFVSLMNNALVGPILSGVLAISDYSLGVTNAISAIGSLIIMSLATKTWIFYVGGFSGLLSVMAAPICRSLMTKIVQPEEVSLLFALVSSVESFTPALATVIDSQIYNATVTFFPSATLLFNGLIFVVALLSFLYLKILSEKTTDSQSIRL
ncbi:Proton-coupled folate transporter [Nymphon striatum]|nr:Proton-coupled folate transporter [Nymphon striatum]